MRHLFAKGTFSGVGVFSREDSISFSEFVPVGLLIVCECLVAGFESELALGIDVYDNWQVIR